MEKKARKNEKLRCNVFENLSVRLEQDKKLYKTQIDLLDHQIDTLVYKLYDLTKEEIKVVEESLE